MKKLFAFVAVALFSVATFASREVVPSDDDLAAYATKTYTMCIYNESACNGIVLNGTYAGWPNAADHATLLDFVAVDGFEGWYVVSWDDESGAAEKVDEGGVQAKPIQLDGSGLFNWDYQLGPDAELIRGTELPNKPIMNPNGAEVDIKNLQPGIVVIDVKSWKNNPCTAVYHVYNVILISPDCNEEDYVVPAISGGFNGWAQEAMTLNELKTAERQKAGLLGGVFEISFKAAEGSEFKFRSDSTWGKDWTNELKEYNAEEDAWQGFSGAGIVAQAENGNLVLGEVTDLEFDLGDPAKYSWNNCEKPGEPASVTVSAKFPAEGCPENVEVIGTFDGWAGTAMTFNASTGYFEATIDATPSDQFKFRAAGTWDIQLQTYIAPAEEGAEGEWKDMDNLVISDYISEGAIIIDFTALEGVQVRWTPVQEGIENVVLTEKVQKVVVDGVIYIVRDNKMFNLQGAQVR